MFRRGLSSEFVVALARLAERPCWWTEVLADPDLIIAVRDEYLNVYWRGQSIFCIRRKGDQVMAETHPKYLLDSAASRRVAFDGERFALPSSATLLLERWEPGVTLPKLKKAAQVYAGAEKVAVHTIVRGNPNVIDVEIALSREVPEDSGDRSIPRIDVLCLEPDGPAVRLAFWEVKLFGNPEIRAKAPAPPPVLGQMNDYRRILEAERSNVLDSYRTVVSNLISINDMRCVKLDVSPLLGQVKAHHELLTLGTPPDVGLVVTGYDTDQRHGAVWKRHRDVLAGALRAARRRFAGNPDSIRL